VNETEQIIRARQGDETAWIALVRHHQAAVFRFAYLLLGDADDAEDVAQETFIRAFRALATFDVNRPLRPWLLQIAKNLASNQRRSLQRYIGALGRWLQAAPRIAPSSESFSLQQEDAQLLWQAIRRLTSSDQEVVYLRYFLELSVAETATALNTAEGTVKSRLSRALARLRVIVEREFPGLRAEVAE
jgi:RNA polymerase sigma factor (sigma-70 family)